MSPRTFTPARQASVEARLEALEKAQAQQAQAQGLAAEVLDELTQIYNLLSNSDLAEQQAGPKLAARGRAQAKGRLLDLITQLHDYTRSQPHE